MVTTVSNRVKVLGWEDVREAAAEAFNVWTFGSELRWAEDAWTHIVAAGLADYTSEISRARVAVRFLSLASLYRDWCCIAHEECLEDDPVDWNSWLEVDKLEIGQLLGDRYELGAI